MFGDAPCARLFEAPLRGETTDLSSGDAAAAAAAAEVDDDENDGDDALPDVNSKAACGHSG